MQAAPKKSLSVMNLIMINVIAIDSLRTLPMGAEYGLSVLFYYCLAGLVFFLPISLVAAELATGWPETGGVYVWVREAFGKRIGFLAIWLQWFYNICWYPTIMSFIAATLAYCIDPNLANNKTYMLIVITIFFWGSTAINFYGLQTSSRLSTLSAVFGTLVPMVFIIILGCVWAGIGKPIEINFSWKNFFPDLSSMQNLVLLTGILYGLVGMEMSASHAAEVKNPQRDYPRAIAWSSVIILCSLMFSSVAIALVVPAKQLNIVAGLLQAFDIFFKAFHLGWFTPILAFLIILGSIGAVNAWILGPSKGLLAASRDGALPAVLSKTNKFGVPVTMLLMQGVIFTGLTSVFYLMPTVSSSFWALSDVTAILALIVYVFMFAAAIRLRYKFPDKPRAFKVPQGNFGMWMVCLIGLASCVFTIGIGFLPPAQIPVGNVFTYELIIIGGTLIGCIVPLVIFEFSIRNNLNEVAVEISPTKTEENIILFPLKEN